MTHDGGGAVDFYCGACGNPDPWPTGEACPRCHGRGEAGERLRTLEGVTEWLWDLVYGDLLPDDEDPEFDLAGQARLALDTLRRATRRRPAS